MATQLAIIPPSTGVSVNTSSPVAGMSVMELGRVLSASGYFKDARDASQAVVKILFGMEIGIGPVSAMMGVHIIEGKPAPSANLIAARIKSSGRYDYRVREHSADVCRIEFFERAGSQKESLGIVEWSMEDAKRAKLAEKTVWKSYPRAMLFARAVAEGARVHCPEIFGGAPVYTPEELGAEVDAEGNAIIVETRATAGSEPVATDAQLDLIGNLKQSHVVDAAERAGIERRLGRGMSKAQASDAIEWLQSAVKERKAAEKATPAEVVEDEAPANDEPLPF